jgi:TldD protein
MNAKLNEISELIDATITGGADYADLYIQSAAGHSVHYESGKTDELSSSLANGSGVRAILNGRTYYLHTPGTSLSVASKAIAGINEICFSKHTKHRIDSKKQLFDANARCEQPNTDFMHEIDKNIRKESKYVKQVTFKYGVSQKNIAIFSPGGRIVEQSRNYCTFTVNIITDKDGILQTGSERKYMSVSPDRFSGKTTAVAIAQAAFDRAMLMLNARHCPAGKMPVLFAGEAGGTIVHEACGHALEADIVEKDFSVYKNKIGERVANEMVTMVDDPTLPDIFGHYNFDDEGTPARRTVLIENGILKQYMTDILTSHIYNYPLTGNGRRESYKSVPIPRMSNTFLLPTGQNSLDDMLGITQNGLFVKKMGGGEVNPTTGDFVFYVAEAYIIENGKISFPVKGATITGNGPETLKNITALGNNLIMDAGICGKSGQGVPVTDGQPSMVVKELTVGGSEA